MAVAGDHIGRGLRVVRMRLTGDDPDDPNGIVVALPPSLTESSIKAVGTTWSAGLETEVGKRLFHAFQDYGAYVVDDAVWGGSAYAIHVERGVETEVDQQYNISLDGALQSSGGPSGAYWRDLHRILDERPRHRQQQRDERRWRRNPACATGVADRQLTRRVRGSGDAR